MSRKLTIEEMHSVANARGGKCLSKVYVNCSTHLEWECSNGHRWKAVPNSVRSGTWCRVCGTSRTVSKLQTKMSEVQSFAEQRGGKCLSDSYINQNTKLKWECAFGHRWDATFASVKHSGTWCRKCSGRDKDISEIRAAAKKRGGKCLSDRYVNSETKLHWECSQGHRWWALVSSVLGKRKTWCRTCAGLDKLSLKEMQDIALARGGQCLSTEYVNSKSKLKWECANGHQWEATTDSVRAGHWCKECSEMLAERICRRYFEVLFNKSFPTRRPRWLINSRENQMELDGYCKELRLAFEHHGRQHYKVGRYTSGQQALMQRQKDDADKEHLCIANGVRLIVIPDLFGKTKLDDLKMYIYEECKRLRVRRPAGMLAKQVSIDSVWSSTRTKRAYAEMQKFAASRNGKCLSTHYVHSNYPLEWECENGHRWPATPSNIRRGKWCSDCAGNKALTIDDFQRIARSHGGKCLTETMDSSADLMRWECKLGHQWEAVGSNVRDGAWCHECGGSKLLTIEEMQKIAKEQGGECLSMEYVNSKTKLEWKCAKGHRWWADANSIRRGYWCHDCGRERTVKSRKLTIELMRDLARQRGGKCLSEDYVNSKTKLQWQCAQGHRWWAIPESIKNQGSWCKKCSRNRK